MRSGWSVLQSIPKCLHKLPCTYWILKNDLIFYSPSGIWQVFLYSISTNIYHFRSMKYRQYAIIPPNRRMHYQCVDSLTTFRPNKETCVFRVMGQKIFGRVGAYNSFFLEKINFCAFWKPFLLSKCIHYFSRKPEKNSRFHHRSLKFAGPNIITSSPKTHNVTT